VGLDAGMDAKPISLLFALAALAASAAARADPPPPGATVVRPVTIDGGPGPKVVQSFPADGATVPAGVIVLKIVFSQAMAPDGWSYARAESGAFPDCLGEPRMLSDQRTFVLLCTVAAHQSFALQINAAPEFANANGRPAAPTVLRFSTGDVGVVDMEAALSQASLTPDDEPIMKWSDRDAGKPDVASASPSDINTADAAAPKVASAP
jgi:hypothetical protein